MRISDWSSDVCSSDLPIFRFHSPPALVTCVNGIAWESRQQVGCSREILLIEQVLNREGEAQIGASNVVHADPGVHYVIGRQILAILRAKFRSMEPVTVQNEFAVERPHRKHPVRGHRSGEEIGRAACRKKVSQYVTITVG